MEAPVLMQQIRSAGGLRRRQAKLKACCTLEAYPFYMNRDMFGSSNLWRGDILSDREVEAALPAWHNE